MDENRNQITVGILVSQSSDSSRTRRSILKNGTWDPHYFVQVKPTSETTKKRLLSRVRNMAPAVGVVSRHETDDDTRHRELISGITAALDGIIWTGSEVIDAEGKLVLDRDGNSEIAE